MNVILLLLGFSGVLVGLGEGIYKIKKVSILDRCCACGMRLRDGAGSRDKTPAESARYRAGKPMSNR